MLTVVSGAPCSGKSTYVDSHRSDGDVVIDLDRICSALGADTDHYTRGDLLDVAIEARRAAIDAAISSGLNAYVIDSRMTAEKRARYEAAGAEFVTLDPGEAECIARAERDGRPDGTVEQIRLYYATFSGDLDARMGDMEERMEEVNNAETGQQTETADVQEQQQEPQPEKHETDWKAEARKWESRAKELLGSQAEQAARADDAEAKLAEATKAKEHAEAVVTVAASSGVPAEFLAFCSNKEQMESFGKLWASYHAEGEPPHAWAKAPSKRLVSSGTANLSNRDIFASLFDQN